MVTPDARRGAVRHLREHWRFLERRACMTVKLYRSVDRYQRCPDPNTQLRAELCSLAEKYPRLGCPMFEMMLKNKGCHFNHKRLERLYVQEKLALRRRTRRKLRLVRQELKRATRPMEMACPLS